MVGMESETAEDRAALVDLVAQIRRQAPRLRLEIALSPLIPKPHTPWEAVDLLPSGELRKRMREVNQGLRRLGLEATGGSARWALVQTAFSRGGRELGPVLVEAARQGGDLNALRRACRRVGLKLEDYRRVSPPYPWNIVALDACAGSGT
jgi:radical SAM superfamily enzyme YgiQ (UPF0313 family)